MIPHTPIDRQNNFDLLRLFAAFMVVGAHVTQHKLLPGLHLTLPMDMLWKVFPGVPIFFVLSGFLITNSWLHSSSWKAYAVARALRIYPALFVSMCVTTGLLYAFGYTAKATFEQVFSWFTGTISLIYAYHTPGPLKGFSGDLPNSSIWTLPVEMNFYMLAPLILLPTVRAKNHARYLVPALLMGLSLAMVLTDSFGLRISHPDPRHTALYHFWWFGMGMLACLGFPRVKPLVAGKFDMFLGLHVGWSLLLMVLPLEDKHAQLLASFTLVPLLFAAAYTKPALAHRLLKGRDYSYGIYLFHRPWIHTLTHLGITGGLGLLALAGLTAFAAWGSWHFIEKPMLMLKKGRSKPTLSA